MSLISALFAYLPSVSSLSALISDRVYPAMAPEDAALPYIVYTIISSEHVRHMTGASNFCARRVQFDCYGASALSCESVFTALSGALEAKIGTIGDSNENVIVLSSGIETERDDYIPPTDASQKAKHRRSVDYVIWHRL